MLVRKRLWVFFCICCVCVGCGDHVGEFARVGPSVDVCERPCVSAVCVNVCVCVCVCVRPM